MSQWCARRTQFSAHELAPGLRVGDSGLHSVSAIVPQLEFMMWWLAACGPGPAPGKTKREASPPGLACDPRAPRERPQTLILAGLAH